MFLTKARRREGRKVLSLINVLVDLFVPLSLREKFCSSDILPGGVPGRQQVLAGFWPWGIVGFCRETCLHDCSFLPFIKVKSTRLLRKVSRLQIY